MPTSGHGNGMWDASECALLLVDYQGHLMPGIRSSNPKTVELNVRYLARAAMTFKIPTVLSTIAVKMGVGQPTVPALLKELPGVPEHDRTKVDAWEDKDVLAAVKKTGRRKIVMGGIYTEVCLAYPVIAALKDGFEVGFVADAVGGLSKEAHDTAIMRMIQAGAVPHTTVALITEWFRDWESPLAQPAREIFIPFLKESGFNDVVEAGKHA